MLSGPGSYYDATTLQRWYGERLQFPIYYGPIAWLFGHDVVLGSNFAIRTDAWRRVRGRVHRHDASVHDDFDLSFHLGERWRIERVRGALMTISMRPFGDARAFARRVAAGFRTVLIHWPHDLPPVRWTRIALRRAGVGIDVRRREHEAS